MTLDYFYGQTGELFSFYRIPKALFQEQRFQSLSTDAKTLYGILLDRMSLSAKNGWLDEQGRVFIIFTIEDILLFGSMEERASVVAEYGKEVRKIEQRISEFTASHPEGRNERSRSLSAGAER